MNRDPFHAIADPTRRAILVLLASQAMTPNAIAEHFHTSRQAVSKHIRVLEECHLVKPRAKGREIWYKLDAKKFRPVADWLEPFRKLWDNRFNNLDELLKKPKHS